MCRCSWLIVLAVAVAATGCGDDDGPTGGEDFVPPQVTLIQPADSVVIDVPRSLFFEARATDNVGVRLAVFYFDGQSVGQDVTGADGLYSFLWQTEPLSAGAHRAVVRAIDWAGLAAADTATVIIR
jgi:hypothetical protein